VQRDGVRAAGGSMKRYSRKRCGQTRPQPTASSVRLTVVAFGPFVGLWHCDCSLESSTWSAHCRQRSRRTLSLVRAFPCAEALRRRLLNGSDFIIGVGGMSNSAGHDNFFNSSWPVVLAKLLSPILEPLGISVTVFYALTPAQPATLLVHTDATCLSCRPQPRTYVGTAAIRGHRHRL
jgi:hypothetical protein